MENLETEEKKLMSIPRRYFLYVYLILPVLLAVMLVDIFYLDSRLEPYMGINALLLPLFVLIFNFPHILASFFSFFDGEYVTFYKKPLFLYLPILLIAMGVLLFVNFELGVALYLIYDVWHGVKQKTGIALILGARPSKVHTAWTILPFISSSVVYVTYLVPSIFPPAIQFANSFLVLLCMSVLLVVSVVHILKSDPKVRLYIFLVSALFFLSYAFVLNGYIFLAVFLFRFVHDVSAFAFYVSHDHNRNLEKKKNWLYRAFSAVPLPAIILTPFLAFTFAYAARTFTDGLVIGYSIIILICMAHFYLESVMWKRDSLHRQHVKVL